MAVMALRTIELENQWLKASILPDVGAKIYDLIWKSTGRNVLWHNPRIAPQPYPVDGIFDNYWCGGWDDCFPTCDACEYRGEQYPNLGELRSLRWSVERVEPNTATLSAFGPISPVRAEKTIVLAPDSPVMSMRYSITNLGPLMLDFLWGTHPALEPSGEMILRIPARNAIVGESSSPLLGKPGQQYSWPLLDSGEQVLDISKVRGRELGAYGGHYATDLEDGWYAVEDSVSQEGFLLSFPLQLCPCLWIWMAYGGYRGHHHVVVEPWTSMPVNLAEAVRRGTSRQLAPEQEFSIEVRATVYRRPETWKDALERVRE
jgi:hypothetical protein